MLQVWSWRTALAVVQLVRLGRIPQLALVVATRAVSLVDEVREAWRARLNSIIEATFGELCTEAQRTAQSRTPGRTGPSACSAQCTPL